MGEDAPVTTPSGPGIGRTFLRLGSTAFGGPIAHLGIFRTELVARRRWLSDTQYADLVALGQFLPGPASSQVGMGVGLLRGGIGGSLRAWLGFTLPSAVVMITAGLVVGSSAVPIPAGLVAGLKAAAAAVVAQAVLAMARSLVRGWVRAGIAVATAAVVLAVPTAWTPVAALAAAGLVGLVGLREEVGPDAADLLAPPAMPRWVPTAALVTFVGLLAVLPLAARTWPGEWSTLVAGSYRAGALVFGGGHVVLPFLEEVAVGSGAVPEAAFLAGYGLANAMPGPLFAFAGYLGAAADGILLGLACLVAVFLPGWLLVLAALGHWHRVAGDPRLRAALGGVNAAVVGVLAAALWNPVITAGITTWPAAALAVLALLALVRLHVPPQYVVLASALVGWALLG
jgi:chromate transporter